MVPTTPPAVQQPGKAGLWVGAILVLIGVFGGIGLFVVGALEVVRGVMDAPAVDLGDERTLQLSAKTYELYLFNESGGALPADDPQVTVESASGASVALGAPTPGTTGQTSAFRSIGTVRISEAGSYTVTVEELTGVASGIDVRVGEDFNELLTGASAWMLGGAVVGLVFFAAGVVLLIVTGMRRSRARRASQAAWYGYAMTPPPYAGGPPAAPGQPPSGQVPPGQPGQPGWGQGPTPEAGTPVAPNPVAPVPPDWDVPGRPSQAPAPAPVPAEPAAPSTPGTPEDRTEETGPRDPFGSAG